MGDSSRAAPRFNTGSAVVTVVVATLVLSVVLLVSAYRVADWRLERARQAWDREMGSWDEVLQRYPSREANGAALDLEQLSAALGNDMAPRSAEGRQRPDPERAEAFKRAKARFGVYVEEQIERPRRGVDPPPPELAAFLDERSAELAAIRRRLIDGPQPLWELKIEQLFAAPIPNLLGNIDLQKLLLADALSRQAGGDRRGALESLEASWRLNAALRDDPVLITQLIRIAVARMQVGALRQLGDVPEVWRQRLASADYREAFLAAMRLDGRLWTQLDDPAAMGGKPNVLERATWKVTRPYMRFCLASVSDQMRERLDTLATAQALCDGDPAYHGADLKLEIPRWNFYGELIAPNLNDALLRVARLELDAELTARLLALEAARAAGGGDWPAPGPSIEASRCCPEERWDYRAEPAGTMTIAFSRDIAWPQPVGPVLPLEFAVEN
jgi:hypothetical protein